MADRSFARSFYRVTYSSYQVARHRATSSLVDFGEPHVLEVGEGGGLTNASPRTVATLLDDVTPSRHLVPVVSTASAAKQSTDSVSRVVDDFVHSTLSLPS